MELRLAAAIGDLAPFRGGDELPVARRSQKPREHLVEPFAGMVALHDADLLRAYQPVLEAQRRALHVDEPHPRQELRHIDGVNVLAPGKATLRRMALAPVVVECA